MYENQYGMNETSSLQNGYARQESYSQNSYGQNNYNQGGAYAGGGQNKKNKKKKGSLGSKILGITCAGILFGCVAGISMVVILRLFPAAQQTETATAESSAPIATVQEVNLEKQSAQQETVGAEAESSQPGQETAGAEAESSQSGQKLAVVTDVTNVVDSVMPSVVSIFGTYAVTENFWGYEFQQEEEGSGSGIIVGENDDELLIVTNNHVVADSTSLSVQFIDEEIYDATVKGTDSDADLAVITVSLSSLSDATKGAIRIATLGDSDTLKVGEPAIAIGNALGYGQSVTTGVISAVNREYTMDEYGNALYLIQTDAAINPGNSGGALLNMYGEVIGINSNKIASTTIEGMGYAIPISTAKPIMEKLMSKKTRVPVSEQNKGYLGISGINVTADVHEAYGLPIGVYLAQVFDNTAAQAAGMKKGDIIISFDGETVETMEELSELLDCTEAGTTVQIGVMAASRDGYEERIFAVTLGGRD